jgi:hypothetical protein
MKHEIREIPVSTMSVKWTHENGMRNPIKISMSNWYFGLSLYKSLDLVGTFTGPLLS